MEEAAGQFAGLQRRQLGRGRGLVQLHPDAGKPPVKLAQDAGQHRGHGEAGERDPHAPDPALRQGPQLRRNARQRAQERFHPLGQQVRPAAVSSTRRRERTNSGAPSAASSWAICRLSAGWATARVSAARRKWSWRATSRK